MTFCNNRDFTNNRYSKNFQCTNFSLKIFQKGGFKFLEYVIGIWQNHGYCGNSFKCAYSDYHFHLKFKIM